MGRLGVRRGSAFPSKRVAFVEPDCLTMTTGKCDLVDDTPAEREKEREDAYYVFVVPLLVVLSSAVTGALNLGFWLGGLVGVVLSLDDALGMGTN